MASIQMSIFRSCLFIENLEIIPKFLLPDHAEADMLLGVECNHILVCMHVGGEEMNSGAERQTRLNGDVGPVTHQNFHGCQMVFEDRRLQELKGTGPHRLDCTEVCSGPCSSGTASCWPSSLWPHAH